MKEHIKFKIRGVVYLLSGALLTLSSVFAWQGLNYIWETRSGTSEAVDGLRVALMIIGFALMAASYLEFLNARITKQNQNDEEET